MGGNNRESFLYILGLIFALTPILYEIIKKGKINWWYFGFLIVLTASIIYLGIDKVNRDNKDKTISEKRIDSLLFNTSKIIDKTKTDSSRFREFENRLLIKFDIKRDSLNNEPVRNIYNTHINKATNVNIGK